MRMPLRVTFDSNVVQRVLCPDEEQIEGAPSIEDQHTVHKAIKSGIIHGFVPKTYFSKEAIPKSIREIYLRRNFRRSPLTTAQCGQNMGFSGVIRVEKNNNTTSASFFRVKQLALMRLYNIRILHTYLWGDIQVSGILESDYYRCDCQDSDIMIRNNECFQFIQNLGVGILSVDWLDSKDGKRSPQEAKHDLKFKNPSAEECDMQMISTHYAHGIDVLCTEDQGKAAGEFSVMRPQNKEALNNRFGIRFCTLHELADMVKQL